MYWSIGSENGKGGNRIGYNGRGVTKSEKDKKYKSNKVRNRAIAFGPELGGWGAGLKSKKRNSCRDRIKGKAEQSKEKGTAARARLKDGTARKLYKRWDNDSDVDAARLVEGMVQRWWRVAGCADGQVRSTRGRLNAERGELRAVELSR